MIMDPITSIAQHITEQEVGTGKYKEGWQQGYDYFCGLEIKWTTIECFSCGAQVYFDIFMRRHRCSECGSGF
jgi:hypothetical protein